MRLRVLTFNVQHDAGDPRRTGLLISVEEGVGSDETSSYSDLSGTQPGRLVNGTYALTDALQVRATNATQTNPAYGAISATPRTLLSYPSWVAADPVTIGFRQTVRPTEALLAGAYEKTLTFTLSTTQP